MNDIEKKMESMKAEFLEKLESLRKEAEEQEKLKPWMPEHGEKYFTIENGVDAVQYIYFGDDIDESNIPSGNCFPTRERAEQVANKMRLLLRLEQLHDMICPDYVPDWEDSEAKFYVYFSHIQNNWSVSCSTAWWYPCMVVFDTEKNAQKAAEILNKELTSRRFTKIRLKTKEK